MSWVRPFVSAKHWYEITYGREDELYQQISSWAIWKGPALVNSEFRFYAICVVTQNASAWYISALTFWQTLIHCISPISIHVLCNRPNSVFEADNMYILGPYVLGIHVLTDLNISFLRHAFLFQASSTNHEAMSWWFIRGSYIIFLNFLRPVAI